MFAQTATAFDARSVALGGSIVADGRGVAGALANPAAMMRMNRRGQSIHLRLGVGGEIRDPGGLIEEGGKDENEGLFDDIETELEVLDGAVLSCDLADTPETVCLSDTEGLGRIAGSLLNLANAVDDEDLTIQATPELGFALTGGSVPVAVHALARATLSARPNITDNDREYLGGFSTALKKSMRTANAWLSIPRVSC